VIKSPDALRSPEIPHRFGWLNQWSDAVARLIGFPDPTRDAELLSRARRTATGGWVVRLTEAPLDLDNPAHLDVLKRAYERFPEIGGRSRVKLPELQREDRLARQCGYNFVVGVKSAAHKAVLFKLDRTLKVVVMDWC